MSNYTAPDKEEGQQWSNLEHNQAKAAINSKLDANKVVQDLSAPSTTTVLSTAGMQTMGLDTGIVYKGNISASTDLNTLTDPGYWLPTVITS